MERVNGLTILKMCGKKSFEDGDIVIAFQKDNLGDEHTSVYKFIESDFIDIETEDHIELFDLVYCSFLIVKPKKADNKTKDEKIDEWCKKLNEVNRVVSWDRYY